MITSRFNNNDPTSSHVSIKKCKKIKVVAVEPNAVDFNNVKFLDEGSSHYARNAINYVCLIM